MSALLVSHGSQELEFVSLSSPPGASLFRGLGAPGMTPSATTFFKVSWTPQQRLLNYQSRRDSILFRPPSPSITPEVLSLCPPFLLFLCMSEARVEVMGNLKKSVLSSHHVVLERNSGRQTCWQGPSPTGPSLQASFWSLENDNISPPRHPM